MEDAMVLLQLLKLLSAKGEIVVVIEIVTFYPPGSPSTGESSEQQRTLDVLE